MLAAAEREQSDDEAAALLSTHERRQRKIAAQIAQIEEAAMQEKSWHLRGEATAAMRPKDSALEIDVVRIGPARGRQPLTHPPEDSMHVPCRSYPHGNDLSGLGRPWHTLERWRTALACGGGSGAMDLARWLKARWFAGL